MESGRTKPHRAFKSRPNESQADALSRQVVRGAPLDAVLAPDQNWTFSRPLVVEIGCGVGLHPIQYASQFPEKQIVAIERTAEKFSRFAGRLAAHPSLHRNLTAVHADAVHFIDQNFAEQSIDEVWILYPNPEMKKTSRRWFETPFMSRLVTLMKPGAAIYFATNIESYAHEAKLLTPRLGLSVAREEFFTVHSRPAFQPRTHFEKKYYLRGETIFDFEFRLSPGAHS